MDDRDWESELKKIDRQLESVTDEKIEAAARAAASRATNEPGANRPAGGIQGTGEATVAKKSAAGGGAWRGWIRLSIALFAAAGLWLWPWRSACGLQLYGLIAASTATALIGVWSAIGSWRHRLAVAHLLSLAVILWGALLVAREVLPRIGYAVPTELRGPNWECGPQPPPPGTDMQRTDDMTGSGRPEPFAVHLNPASILS